MEGEEMDNTYRLNRLIDEHNRRLRMSDGHTEMAREMKALEKQVDGNHYQKLGGYQPWLVLQAWLTPEEFRGYMKGSVIAYLAREKDKGGMVDIEKAAHTLQALVEMGK